jgi:hypothetical protein
VLVVICVLGFASIALARYSYQHPASAASGNPPTTSDTWFAADSINTCGGTQPALAPNPGAAAAGATALADGVIQVNPVTKDQTGSNATLSLFVDGYKGLTVTPDELVVPASGKHGHATTWKSGTTCPKGTRDAGKVGYVEIAHWAHQQSSTPTTTTAPGNVRFTNSMLITIAFVPKGTTIAQPPNSAVDAMLAAQEKQATTSTTTTTTTTTNSSSSSSTSSSTTSTTAKP